MTKRVFVCSPLAPRDGRSLEDNMRLAELLCLRAAEQGVSPYAPHLLFTRFLDDNTPEARERGIAAGEAWLDVSDELWMFAPNESACSSGMLRELKRFQGGRFKSGEIQWLPACWAEIHNDIAKALRDGPRTLTWELQRAQELRRQAEDAAARAIAAFLPFAEVYFSGPKETVLFVEK